MNLGLTLPNLAFDAYTAADLAALDDLKPSILVMLLYGGVIDVTHAQQLGTYLGIYEPTLLFRPYAGNIPQWKPQEWARECFKRINDVGLAGECVPANEFNIEGFGTDWQGQITWLTAFAAEWRKLSSRKLHLPALSPVEGYQYGVIAYAQAGIFGLYDVVDLHCYTTAHLEVAATVARGTTKPCVITEYNQVSSETVAASGLDSVYFLLGGTPDQAQYDILKNQAAYDSFKAATGGHVPTTTFNVGQGVKDLMAANGDAPQSDEHYVNDATGATFKSETFGTKGLYVWSKTSNKTVILPFR